MFDGGDHHPATLISNPQFLARNRRKSPANWRFWLDFADSHEKISFSRENFRKIAGILLFRARNRQELPARRLFRQEFAIANEKSCFSGQRPTFFARKTLFLTSFRESSPET